MRHEALLSVVPVVVKTAVSVIKDKHRVGERKRVAVSRLVPMLKRLDVFSMEPSRILCLHDQVASP